MDVETITPFQWRENEGNLSKLLENRSVRDKIPLLNVNKFDQFGNSKLVRFQGMIQDMHSPEYYLETFEVVNKTTNEKSWMHSKYIENITLKDDEDINFSSPDNVTLERQTFIVISVPAVNSWVHSLQDRCNVYIPKRVSENVSNNKRVHDETMDIEETACPSTSHNFENKKLCNDSCKSTEKKPIPGQPNDIFPLPTSSVFNQVYDIKVYSHHDKLKMNDVCEFVGFLDVDPLIVNQTDYEMDTLPTTSFFPKIHCIYFKKLEHSNPLLSDDLDNKDKEKITTVRKDLLVVLTQLLLGDALAAEYLLLHLISKVHLRTDALALGKLSLNLSNIPQLSNLYYPDELYKFIQKLVPKSFYLPMTLENLNDLTFVPKKNYNANYLSSGLLQLSNNTHFVLDEIKLTPGKLNEAGLNNIKAISSAIKNQTIAYDFKFYPLEFHCDIPFFILSEGKSMVQSDVHVILQSDVFCINTFKEIVEAAEQFLKPELLNDIRKYLTLSRMSEYFISEQVEEFIQTEFVKMRQNRSNASADDLHSMLILARLVSISEGKTSFDEESWKKASEMEEQRKSRIKN